VSGTITRELAASIAIEVAQEACSQEGMTEERARSLRTLVASIADAIRRHVPERPPARGLEETPERIWWCYDCPGGIGVWGIDSDEPIPRCPDCKGSHISPVKFTPASSAPAKRPMPRPRFTSTRTHAYLDVDTATFADIRERLEAVDYSHTFGEDDGRPTIDMHGIALRVDPLARRRSR
jgi:hypothetical protein